MIRRVMLGAGILMAFGMHTAHAQPNVLVNGDFEFKPPPKFGNNIGHSIAPWVLGQGQQPNVVKVDGPAGYEYGSLGPQSDASAPGAGIPQHYLDITNGRNEFYQSFTPQCSGEVEFGGSFSTRDNLGGRAQVTIREGVGISGPVVGQTNIVPLAGGNSRNDPWTPVSFTAQITAGTTYSFVVDMPNNLNFDNGFVRYEQECPASSVDSCCPPWNSGLLEEMLFYSGSGGIAKPYTLIFQPTALFKTQIQSYIDYLSTLNPAMNMITIHFRLHDAGTGVTPVVGPQIGLDYYASWVAGGGGQQFGNTGFFTLAKEPMQVNRWYRVHTGIYLDSGWKFFPDECAVNEVDVRIQVQRVAFERYAAPVLQVRKADGSIVERRLPPVN